MAGTLKLWLARHARPLCAEGLCYGATDVEADPQATAVAAAGLAAALPRGLRVVHSPLRRCVQLATALQALRPDLPCRADADLAEMDFGAWEGLGWDAIGQPAIDRWSADFARHRCGGGECVEDFVNRVAGALERAATGGGGQAWIAHAGVASALRWLAAGGGVPRDAGAWPRAGLAFGAWTCLDVAWPVGANLRENVQPGPAPLP